MAGIPRDPSFDSTLALLLDPYRFISERCRRLGTDLFETHLRLEKVICMSGPDAARLFYDTERFERSGAAPARVQKTLFGVGGVQALDGEEHSRRKLMFMSMMGPDRRARLTEIVDRAWLQHAERWSTMDTVHLYPEAQQLLTRAACEWAGVPLPESEVGRRTRELAALFDYAGRIGPKHWYSRRARKQAESWLSALVTQIRDGQLTPAADTPAYTIAWHRDLSGNLLDATIAAVELLNVIRPLVAVSVYIVFAAHAQHLWPACAEELRTGKDAYAELFTQEVRRFYPFFPAVIARVRRDFEWQGYEFAHGQRALLDLYGTNHDRRAWDAPDEFRPDRFRNWNENPFTLIPQGGGDHYRNHRCAGEWITTDVLNSSSRFLAERLRYDVPPQDLSIDFTRLPALPRSGLRIRSVRLRVRP